MNKMLSHRKAILFVLFIATAALQGCSLFGGGSGEDYGELVGVQGREGWVMTVPYGMVVVPAGTFHMGQADEDVAATQINYNKQITIGSFYMDDTEITNNEYRQFVNAMLGRLSQYAWRRLYYAGAVSRYSSMGARFCSPHGRPAGRILLHAPCI